MTMTAKLGPRSISICQSKNDEVLYIKIIIIRRKVIKKEANVVFASYRKMFG